MKNQKNVIIGVSFLLVLLSTFFLTPNYDDGQGAYWINNTIDLEKPFYSDYFKARFVVEKIPTLIMALGFTYFFPFSFTFPAILYGLLSLLCSFLAYKISRFYIGSKKALLCSQLFLYSILTHNWICPTRSELWLLIVILMVIYFFEMYQKNREKIYLIIISLFIGVLGLPLHPNASILYVYLIGYLIVNKDIVSGKNLMVIIKSLVFSSVIGIGIVLYPDPIESINFLKTMSTESSNRFIPNIINIKRFLFIITLPYYKYIVGLFILLLIGWMLGNWKELNYKIKCTIKRYKNIFLYFGSAIIGIEILPAAEWTIYFIYYFFPLSFIASKLLFNFIFVSTIIN